MLINGHGNNNPITHRQEYEPHVLPHKHNPAPQRPLEPHYEVGLGARWGVDI